MFARRPPPCRELDVTCPRCQSPRLVLRTTCLATDLSCPHCAARLTLADLAPVLDDDAFTRVANSVGDRLADRV